MKKFLKPTLITILFAFSLQVVASSELYAPKRFRGLGPFERMLIQNVTIIKGDGAPPIGSRDVIIENNQIRSIRHHNPNRKTEIYDQVIKGSGMYVIPGFIDMHGHLGGKGQNVPAEYVLKLWLAHGITTVRDPGSFMGEAFTLAHSRASENNSIAAPRLVPYAVFGMGEKTRINSTKRARQWVKKIAKKGFKGIKFFGGAPKVIAAAIEQAKAENLLTTMHHAQTAVSRLNVLDSAKMGLDSMEHWYGLPEAMLAKGTVQNYPADYDYNNEQDRFREAGNLWKQTAKLNSKKWQDLRTTLIELDFTIDPTLTIYEATRDLMTQRQAYWHDEFTHPNLWSFFKPSKRSHGSFWFNWTTENEIAWRKNFRIWMDFLNDFKDHGGRVTVGSDSGYLYKVYGFGYIRELELLQEAGFHPLEVLKSATFNGAEALKMDKQVGTIEVGKSADLVVLTSNPLANFKSLYASGHFRLGSNNQEQWQKSIRYTIKDGIVYETEKLIYDIKKLVKQGKQDPVAH